MTISKTHNGKSRPGLVWCTQSWGYAKLRTQIESFWIFEGTEDVVMYPQSGVIADEWGPWTQRYGIPDYGSVKVKDYEHRIVYKVAKEALPHLVTLDWTVVKTATYYAYVTRGDLK